MIMKSLQMTEKIDKMNFQIINNKIHIPYEENNFNLSYINKKKKSSEEDFLSSKTEFQIISHSQKQIIRKDLVESKQFQINILGEKKDDLKISKFDASVINSNNNNSNFLNSSNNIPNYIKDSDEKFENKFIPPLSENDEENKSKNNENKNNINKSEIKNKENEDKNNNEKIINNDENKKKKK